jgi:hypothetical protein
MASAWLRLARRRVRWRAAPLVRVRLVMNFARAHDVANDPAQASSAP